MILRIFVFGSRDGSAWGNIRRRKRGIGGFVWRYFVFDWRSPLADAWVVGGRYGPRADAWAVGGRGHSGSLQLAEGGVGLVMDSLESRFVTGHQRQAARLIGQRP